MPAYIYRVSQWLEKRFNAKGGGVITDLDPSLGAELSFPSGVEDRYLQGWNRFAFLAVQAAVAANFSRVRIRNPPGSNVIAVMEMITVLGTAASDQPILTYGATITDLTGVFSLTFTRQDPRGNPQPSMIISAAAQAAGGTPILQKGVLQNTNAEFILTNDQQIPLLPGQVIDLQSNIANTQLNVNFMWRERALELSELT